MKIVSIQPATGNHVPASVQRLDYVSAIDGSADWALIMPGERPQLWIVVLHGHGSSGDQLFSRADLRSHWLPALTACGAGIICPNLRGNAWMSAPAAADLSDLLAWLRLEWGLAKTLFCAGSMGGSSSLIYAVLHPDQVDGLVVRGAATDLASYYQWCECQTHPILRQIGQAIHAGYGTPAQQPELFRRHSALANATKLTMPIAFTHGGSDATIPVEQARRLAEKLAEQPNFRYKEIPGGNHDSPLYESDDFQYVLAAVAG